MVTQFFRWYICWKIFEIQKRANKLYNEYRTRLFVTYIVKRILDSWSGGMPKKKTILQFSHLFKIIAIYIRITADTGNQYTHYINNNSNPSVI